MNHLIVSREYPPCDYAQGGIGTYLSHIARLLAESGETVYVIGEQWTGAPSSREVDCDGRLIVHRVSQTEPLPQTPEADKSRARKILEGMSRSPCPVQAFAWQAGLLAERLVEEVQIDCIEAQEYEAPLYYFLLRRATGFGPTRRPPCFVHLHSPTQFIAYHNDWNYGPPGYLTVKRMEDYVIQASDGALCPSRYLGRQIEQHYGLGTGAVEHIPLPKGDTACVARTPETWRSGTVCYVGRLELRKGVLEWIDAVVDVAQERPDARFEFIGSDAPPLAIGRPFNLGHALHARIPESVRPAISILGAQPRAQVLERLRNAQMVVVPSRWENFPNTCVEAMSSGLPVLSTPDGGMTELNEDGVTGWIAENGSPAALARALRRALDTPAERKASMGAAAAAAVEATCGNAKILDRHLSYRARLVARGTTRSAAIARGHTALTVSATLKSDGDVTLSRTSSPTSRNLESARGVVVVIDVDEPAALAECLASVQAQTQPPGVVLVVGDRRRSCSRAEPPPISLESLREALTFVVSSDRNLLGIAFVPATCHLAPAFVECVERILLENANVGLVSTWMEESAEQTVMIKPSPQRPYQWLFDDVSAAPAFRLSALRNLQGTLAALRDGMTTPDIALAVLLDGWGSVTIPEILCARARPVPALTEAIASLPATRTVQVLMQRFASEVAEDAIDVLTLMRSPPAGFGDFFNDTRRWT